MCQFPALFCTPSSSLLSAALGWCGHKIKSFFQSTTTAPPSSTSLKPVMGASRPSCALMCPRVSRDHNGRGYDGRDGRLVGGGDRILLQPSPPVTTSQKSFIVLSRTRAYTMILGVTFFLCVHFFASPSPPDAVRPIMKEDETWNIIMVINFKAEEFVFKIKLIWPPLNWG